MCFAYLSCSLFVSPGRLVDQIAYQQVAGAAWHNHTYGIEANSHLHNMAVWSQNKLLLLLLFFLFQIFFLFLFAVACCCCCFKRSCPLSVSLIEGSYNYVRSAYYTIRMRYSNTIHMFACGWKGGSFLFCIRRTYMAITHTQSKYLLLKNYLFSVIMFQLGVFPSYSVVYAV